jgi:hypothetical protein
MSRPKGLTLTAILMVLCGIATLGIVLRPWRSPAFIVIVIVGSCIASFIIWAYWKGRNWARNCVLSFSVLSVLALRSWNTLFLHHSLFTTPSHSLPIAPTRMLMAARSILGVALLYYLNTRPVRDFFHLESKQAPSNSPAISPPLLLSPLRRG